MGVVPVIKVMMVMMIKTVLTLLSSLQLWFSHLILIAILGGRYYSHSHFRDGKNLAQTS